MSDKQTKWRLSRRGPGFYVLDGDETVVGLISEMLTEHARLMVAAPAMRDALLAVQEDYRDLLRVATSNDEADEIDSMLTIVNEALALAEVQS